MIRRVAVTGLGVISPVGNDKDTAWKALKEGQNGISRVTKFDVTDFKATLAAEVKDFDPLAYMAKGDLRKNDLYTQYAVARGANIYAEVTGYGNTDDAHHITAPDPEAAQSARAIKLAMDESVITGGDGVYVNAHGTGTPLNDKTETNAIKKAFGAEQAAKLKVSSTKSMTGHMLGAAGAMEAFASVMALREGVIPPTINYSEPDPDCDLFITPNKAIKANIKYALSSSLGFGGHNACLAFKITE